MLRWVLLCAVFLVCATPAHAGPGVVGTYQTPLGASAISELDDLLIGPDGTLWFSDRTAGTIGKMTPTGSFTTISLPPGASPQGMTTTTAGTVVYADAGRGVFGRFAPDGALSEVALPPEAPGARPTSILTFPDVPISWWTAGPYYGPIANFGAWGGTGLQLPGGASSGEGIAFGADGRFWWPISGGLAASTTDSAHTLTIYAAPASNVAPGPDGNVWFSAPGNNSVGRITPAGSFTLFPLPTANARPGDIVTGADGNVWFTELAGQIGRINPSTGVVTEFPVPGGMRPVSIITGRGGLLWFTALGQGFSGPGAIGYATTGLDTSSPSIQVDAPADGAELRVGAAASVTYTCSDEAGGTGVRSCTGNVASGTALDTSRPGPIDVTLASSDLGGNVSSATRHYTVAAPPTVDLQAPADGATFIAGAAATASYRCSPGVGSSGIGACSGPVASGGRLDTSSPGRFSFAVTAKDHAGNQVTTTHSYRVVAHATARLAARVSATWRESRLQGALTVSGKAGAAESLRLSLVSTRGKIVHRYSLKLKAGAFQRRLALPARLLPGAYAVRVTGIALSGQAARAAVVATITPARISVPRPDEGLVDRAWVTGPGVAPAIALHGSQRALTAHFHFAVLPRSGQVIRVTWYASGSDVPVGFKDAAPSHLVTSDVHSSTPLRVGVYRAVLSAGGVTVARATIRLT